MGGPVREEVSDDIVGDRDRLLSIGMGAVFAACVVFAGIRLVAALSTGQRSPWWSNACGAVAIGLLRVWVRASPKRRSTFAVHGTALTATVALLIPAAYGMTSSKWWLSLVAFSVLLMGRRREAIVWTVTTLVLLPLTAVLEPHILIDGAIGESPAERSLSVFCFLVLLLGVTGLFRRVAQQRAKALTETAASLERSNRVRSRFLAHMSHELRTPLHGVIAMTDLAMRGDASPSVHDQVATAQQSARVLLELLNNILDVTRADADAIDLAVRTFSLHALLTEVLRPFEARARERGLVLRATSKPAVAEARMGDRVRVSQIVMNLVSNALKFTDAGTIVVELAEATDEPNRITLSVTDTGRGIEQEDLPRIFEPFAQLRVSAEGVDRGAGLGLAIVRELATRMHGGVDVTSEVGVGSKFVVTLDLPREERRAATAGPTQLLAPKPAESVRPTMEDAKAKRSLVILVCEDDPVSQRVAGLMLKRLGHDVTIAEDGLQAWKSLVEREFDLLLTDVEMPELDGVALTRRVRDRELAEGRRRLPIIAATAHVGEDERHRLLAAGVDVHVPKPFTLAALSSAVEHATARIARASDDGPVEGNEERLPAQL